MKQCDWARWHDAYDDPGSSLNERLRTVRAWVGVALDEGASRVAVGQLGQPGIR
ncbi:hypothetical protein AB0I81_03265 [Nonomuraea sp. NPDC050404]|uniref:hypothetical protein n=1 Tax=Nonomuraea sp. NPDC050404 TaxID=3155783 RepID=UPI0033E19318